MKNKKWSIALVVCMLAALLAVSVQAAGGAYVVDEANLLTQEELYRLDELADSISMEYDCGVYAVAVWDYQAYGSTVRSAAENYFTSNNLGLGSDHSGVLLFLSMAARDYALIAHGEIANTTFTDYGKDRLTEAFLDDFQYDDWPGGLTDYVVTSGSFLETAAKGKPVDVPQGGMGLTLVMVLLIPAAIAGIVCAVMASSMKTARSKTHANDYRGQVQITGSRDQYLTRTVVRQKIESSSSGSRGGTTVNSRGFSGKSGKF